MMTKEQNETANIRAGLKRKRDARRNTLQISTALEGDAVFRMVNH